MPEPRTCRELPAFGHGILKWRVKEMGSSIPENLLHAPMRLLTAPLVILSFALSTQAQDHHAPSGHGTANYDLAAR